MIRQEVSPELVNRVSNLPEVRAGVCYQDGPMDWAPVFPASNTGVVVLSNGDDACMVFERTGERTWQAHIMLASTCRGRRGLEAARSMVELMRPVAVMLWASIPLANRAARWFSRQVGFAASGLDVFDAEGEVELFVLRFQP